MNGFSSLWWVLVVVGIGLITLEIFTAGFVVMWFGIAMIITALPVYLGAQPAVVIATFAVSALLLTVFVRRITIDFFSRRSRHLRTNVDSVLGREGVVVEEIHAIKGTGKVRVEKEVWTATSQTGATIGADKQVWVRGVNGVKLVVSEEEKP